MDIVRSDDGTLVVPVQAERDLEQNPDRGEVVSTSSGRQEAVTLVHAVAISPDHAVAPAVLAELD